MFGAEEEVHVEDESIILGSDPSIYQVDYTPVSLVMVVSCD
jgi:hypothetical protein